MEATAATLAGHVLLAVLAPVWLLSGLADWACHKRLAIERTSGLPESLLHWLMLAEMGVGVLAALLLEPTAGAFALMAAACAAHELTVWVDLRYAGRYRAIPWYEQAVHGIQQTLPWVGLWALALLEPAQVLAAIGLGDAAAVWSLRWRAPALPWPLVAAFLGAAAALVLGPFAGELLRCWRAAKAPASRPEFGRAQLTRSVSSSRAPP